MIVHHRVVCAEYDIIVTSVACKMPGTCWGTYRTVRVVKVKSGTTPGNHNERNKNIIWFLSEKSKLHEGKHFPTGKCAASEAVNAGIKLAIGYKPKDSQILADMIRQHQENEAAA